MKEFRGTKWQRGQLLITRITANLDEESRERSNKIERSFIFSSFNHLDDGKSRKRVCIVDVSHQNYEANANLIAAAPELLEALMKIENSSQPSSEEEADIFIRTAKEIAEEAINKALGL